MVRPLWSQPDAGPVPPATAGVWAYNFVEDRTCEGRRYSTLNIVDEFTRECLAIKVARRLNSMNVIETLADLFLLRGVPAHIRSDQGPERRNLYDAQRGTDRYEGWRQHCNRVPPHSSLGYKPPAPEIAAASASGARPKPVPMPSRMMISPPARTVMRTFVE
jgi:putative transposase